MRYSYLSHAFEVEDIVGIVRLNYAKRIAFHDGTDAIAPGISVHFVGEHTGGLVVASDATHYYENMDSGRPFTTAYHVGDMLEAFDTMRALAPSRDHIIPGHDPLVMTLYPAARPDLEDVAVGLDVAPHK